MIRVGGALLFCFAAVACEPAPPPEQPKPPRETAAERAERYAAHAVPVAERPVLGKVGDTTCEIPDTEVMLAIDAVSCLSLLKDTLKPDSAAREGDVRLVRLRASFFQPGPQIDGGTAGWVLYAMRLNCDSQQVWVMGNVLYSPDGVEISRATPAGGPLPLPVGLAVARLIAEVCPT